MPCNSVGDTEHSYSDYPVSRGSGPALRSVAPSHSDCVAWTFHFRDLRAFQLDVSELAGHSCHSGSLAFAIAPVYNTPPLLCPPSPFLVPQCLPLATHPPNPSPHSASTENSSKMAPARSGQRTLSAYSYKARIPSSSSSPCPHTSSRSPRVLGVPVGYLLPWSQPLEKPVPRRLSPQERRRSLKETGRKPHPGLAKHVEGRDRYLHSSRISPPSSPLCPQNTISSRVARSYFSKPPSSPP